MSMIRKWISGLVCVLCALSLLMALIPAADAAEFADTGYSCLQTDGQRYAYTAIVDGLLRFQTRIPLNADQVLTEEDISFVREMIQSDHPELFWFADRYRYEHNDGIVVTVMPEYAVSVNGTSVTAAGEEMYTAIAAVSGAAQTILDAMPSGLTDYETALYLHDYLANTVVYEDTENDQTIYGALVEGRAVCAGYTRAYQYLLGLAGIKSWYVAGLADNGSGEGPENHAWNLVWLDGSCYYTDVTWDDTENGIYHTYFCIPMEEIEDDHYVSEMYRNGIPAACGHMEGSYFDHCAGVGTGIAAISSSTAASTLAKYFIPVSYTGNEATFRCNISFDGEDFPAWFKGDRYAEVSKALGLNGSKCNMLVKRKETIVTITGNADYVTYVSSRSAAFTESSVSLAYIGQQYLPTVQISPGNASNQTLSFASQDPSIASVDPSTGIVTAVGEGQTTITAKTVDGDSAQITVAVSSGHSHDLKHFEEVDAQEDAYGRKEHYLCNFCGAMFYDEDGDEPVEYGTDLLLEPESEEPEETYDTDDAEDPEIPAWIPGGVLLLIILLLCSLRKKKK